MLERGNTWHPVRFPHVRDLLSHGFGIRVLKRVKISSPGFPVMSLKSGDTSVAHDMATGIFRCVGMTINAKPIEIFDMIPASGEWANWLRGLSWLHDFVESGQELHRIIARKLIMKWGEKSPRHQTARTNATALISLSRSTPFLIHRSASFQTHLFPWVERLIHRVIVQRATSSEDEFQQIVALLYASLAFRTTGNLRENALGKFVRVINQIILPDGGHVSREPLQLLETLADLVPLRDTMLAHHLAVPQSMTSAIERMIPMLRMLCHGDDSLANFQGAGLPRTRLIKSVFERDTIRGKPLQLAPHAGFARLAHCNGLLLVDVGQNARCEGALALEFSDGRHRIFINCGMPLLASSAWQDAASSAAAHSTLQRFGNPLCRQNSTDATIVTSPQGSLLKCQNKMAGDITHERALFLSQDGKDFRGEDILSGEGKEQGFVLRFHLHPQVRASSIRSGAQIVVLLPSRAAWEFSARGGTLSLEESVFLGGEEGPCKTLQIVIRASAPVQWALRKLDRASIPVSKLEDAPRLPF